MARKRKSLHLNVPLPKEPPKPEPEKEFPVPELEGLAKLEEIVNAPVTEPLPPPEPPDMPPPKSSEPPVEPVAPSAQPVPRQDLCVCGHRKSSHGALMGNIKNMGSCNVVNCSCRKYTELV